MPIDATIISGLKPPQTNPLETAAQAMALKKGVLDTRLLEQEVAGKIARGKASQAAINPITGEYDPAVAMRGIAETPEGAQYAGEMAVQNQAITKAKIDAATAQLEQQRKELGLAQDQGKVLGNSLLPGIRDGLSVGPDGKPKGISKQAAAGLIAQGIATAGITDPKLVARARAFLNDLSDDDPEGNLGKVTSLAIMVDPTPDRVSAVYGSNSVQDAGSKLLMLQTPGLTGEPQVRGAIEKELAPSQLAGLVKYTNEAGKEVTETLSEFLKNRGASVAGPAPGVVEAQTASGTASAGAYQKDLAEAGGYAQRVQGLDKAVTALDKALTGPGATKVQQWSAVLNTFGIKGGPDVDSYAEAQKYLQDYANKRGADLGVGTDAGRALINTANPGVQTPKGAALEVVKVIKGLERMQAAQVAAAQAEGITPDKYADWKAKWNRSVDPAAFSPPRLTKAEWEAKRKSMGSKWDSYKKGLDAALDAGVISAADLRK